MSTFRLQIRFLVPLLLTLGIAAYLAVPLVDGLTLRWFSRDLSLRGQLVTDALSDSIATGINEPAGGRLLNVFNKAAQNERLIAIALCSRSGELMESTADYPTSLSCARAGEVAARTSPVTEIAGGPVHVGVHQVADDSGSVASLVLLQDFSFIDRRSQDTRQYLVLLIAALGAAMALVTLIVAQISWRGWVSGAQALLRGEGLIRPLSPSPSWPPSPPSCVCACATSTTSTAARWASRRTGRPSVCAACCARSCAATRSSWSPTASLTSTTASPRETSSCAGRRAGW